MPAVPPRRIARWKILLGTFGGIAVLIGVFWLWIATIASRRWAEMERDVAASNREMLSRPAARPVLRGDAGPGNAWYEYAKVPQAIKPVMKEYGRLTSFLQGNGRVGRKTAGRVVASLTEALDHIQRGARCGFSNPPPPDPGSDGASLPNFYVVQFAEQVGAAQARLLAGDGRIREAVDLLLDLCQFARDLADTGRSEEFHYARRILNGSLNELGLLALSGRMTTDELAGLDRALEVLDGSLRNFSIMERAQVTAFGSACLGDPDLYSTLVGSGSPLDLGLWRFGFSVRLMAATAYRDGVALAGSLQDRGKPWMEAQAIARSLHDRAAAGHNVALSALIYGCYGSDESCREYRARLRILRIAVHYRWSGEFLDLADPFGGRIRIQEDGCRYKVWSVWREVESGYPPKDLTLRFER